MSYRNKIFIGVLISVIITVALYLILPKSQRTFINIIGIVGFVLSVLGITISYLQILSVKDIAEKTQMVVNESIRLNNNIFMLSDLSRHAAMISEIQTYLRADKIEMCILRMKDLKLILNSLKNQEVYGKLFSKREFRTVFEHFNIDLDNFQTHHFSVDNRLDKAKIIINLEVLSTLLLGIETKLKSL